MSGLDRMLKAVADLEDIEGNLRKAVALNLLGFGPHIGPMTDEERWRHMVALSDCNKAIMAVAKAEMPK